MPSSKPITSQLGPAIKVLKQHLAAANALLRAGSGRDIAQLRAMSHHLSRTLDRVNALNEKWTSLIDRLEGQALAIEERIYREFPPLPPEEGQQPRPKHFMEIAEQARRALNQINTLLEPSTIASSSD